MKVRELQEKLAKLDPEVELACYCEDEEFLVDGRHFTLFEVEAVSSSDAERVRLDDGTPYLKFGKSAASTTIGIIEITSKF